MMAVNFGAGPRRGRCRTRTGEQYDRRHGDEEAAERIDEHLHAGDGNACQIGCVFIAAEGVNHPANRGDVEQERRYGNTDDHQHDGDRQPIGDVALADKLEGRRQVDDRGLVGDDIAETLEDRQRAERHDERMDLKQDRGHSIHQAHEHSAAYAQNDRRRHGDVQPLHAHRSHDADDGHLIADGQINAS